MNEVASTAQLRMAFIRWALFCVPLLLLLGYGTSVFANSGLDNRWYAALVKPAIMPPSWSFSVIWGVLYILQGIALAIIISARKAPLRWPATIIFVIQFLLCQFWPIYFFAMHQVGGAFVLLLLVLFLGICTAFVFARVRTLAAWLMVPYLAWLCVASLLNLQIDQLNPEAETLIVPRTGSMIALPAAK